MFVRVSLLFNGLPFFLTAFCEFGPISSQSLIDGGLISFATRWPQRTPS